MTLSLASSREAERWYRLIDHPVQTALVNDLVRFKLIPAGRRSGKTERFKRFVAREAMQTVGRYFVAAPTRDQVRRIYWDDLKLLTFSSFHARKPSETNLIIYLPNGSEINLVGLDQPQRMEGIAWTGGGIDEIADVHPDAWELNISPALDTYNPNDPDYRAWCWLLGVPEGLNHYYEMCEYARTANDPDWKLYTWHSADILPADIIESAKRRLSPQQYRQEYEASFETTTGRIYPDYNHDNVTTEEIAVHEQLCWMHDFNYSPMSSAVGVVRNGNIYLLDEIVLQSAVAKQTAIEFADKFSRHENKKVIVYGDPAGKAGEKHGHASDYTEIESTLRRLGWEPTRKVKAAAPAIRDRQNAVRAKVCNAAGERHLFVNPNKAKYCHKGLSTVTVKDGSTYQEQDGEYQHITTAIGYYIDYEWPVNKFEPKIITPVARTNHWNN